MSHSVKMDSYNDLEDWRLFSDLTLENRAKIIQKYQPLVFHIYHTFFPKRSSESIDIISEGTLGLIEAVDTYDISRGAKFKTYAFYKIKGKMLDYLRARRRLLGFSMPRDKDTLLRSLNVSSSIDMSELDAVILVETLLNELTPSERSVMELIYSEGISQEEVAKRLGCTPANVSILKKRALSRLRSRLLDKLTRKEKKAYGVSY